MKSLESFETRDWVLFFAILVGVWGLSILHAVLPLLLFAVLAGVWAVRTEPKPDSQTQKE